MDKVDVLWSAVTAGQKDVERLQKRCWMLEIEVLKLKDNIEMLKRLLKDV